MEAKDTVIKITDAETDYYTEYEIEAILAKRLEQAEISFKAGIKEVVDYFNSHGLWTEKEKQAKLKEWGVE